jgi:hypothetical protein
MKNFNEIVNVNSFYFPGGSVSRALPRTIEYGFNRVSFNDGLQYLVQKGNQLVKLFDMSDGRNTYRLRFEHDEWTLVSVKPQRAMA